MKRGGQAFLITAVIFIAIVSALITIHNYSKKTEFSTFPYIAEEIQIESEKVMDYALVNNDYSKINGFTQDISDYTKKENIDVYFITGDLNNLNFKKPDKDTTGTMSSSGSEIKITIKGADYFFPKTQGKHFYFIMIKEMGGEKYVYTNA